MIKNDNPKAFIVFSFLLKQNAFLLF
jgi:hypothetical protein